MFLNFLKLSLGLSLVKQISFQHFLHLKIVYYQFHCQTFKIQWNRSSCSCFPILTKARINKIPLPPKNGWQKSEFVISIRSQCFRTLGSTPGVLWKPCAGILWSKLLLFCRCLPDSQVKILLQFSIWRKSLIVSSGKKA